MPSKRQLIFLGAAALLLAIIWSVVWSELILRMDPPAAIRKTGMMFFVITYALELIFLAGMRNPKQHAAGVFGAFFFIGLFVHLFCAAVIKDFLLFIPGVAGYEKPLSFIFFVTALGINFGGIYVAFAGPLIRRVQIPLPAAHADLNSFKIVQISDLHAGPLIGKKYIKRVVEMACGLDADITVLTGDIGDSDAELFGSVLAPLEKLKTKSGVFYVTGNHEYYWNAEKWIRVLKFYGAHPLLNDGLLLQNGKLWLGGVTDPDGPRFMASHVPDAVRACNKERSGSAYKILLAHQPKNCFAAEKAGFDLMLSGHTHGGQFFPFNLLVGLFNPYHKGLNRHHRMLVYVNQGTGFWGPALRLGVRAEITLLELRA